MIEQARNYPVVTALVLAFYYGVGVVGLTLDRTAALFQSLVPFTLLFSLYFLWLFHEGYSLRFYLVSLVIFALGFLVEVLGVNTGVIFGSYAYGPTLGFQLWNTPLVIGVNWLLLIYSTWTLTGIFTSSRWIRYIAGSLLMVVYDLALEPVAIRLDMWSWDGNVIPLQNYIAWFVISLGLFLLLDLNLKQVRNKIAPALFIIQFVFFVILNLIL